MSALLAITILLPVVAAAVTPLGGSLGAPVSIGASAASFALAGVLLVAVALSGPVHVSIAGGAAGLYATRVSAVLLLLVFGVGTVVQAFARRYLRGDPRAGRFFSGTALLVAATGAMVSSATLIGLAAAWSVAGAALCLLLGMYPQLPAAADGARRTARAFLAGDAALWVGVAIATATWGDLDLRDLHLHGHPAALAVVACLIVVAALSRSAQLPFQRWLPATLAAPTPVSALLHAGVVNAGGILLVRMSPLFGASAIATRLAFVLGAASAVYGTLLMLAKPDVKGALAHSTMGQMGFMVMTCGLGAFAAAVFHLVAHGMYKATLFLGSGSAVHGQVRHAKSPPVAAAPSRAAAAAMAGYSLLLPAAALLAAIELIRPHLDGRAGSGALFVFAWASGAWACAGWMRRHRTGGGAAAAAGAALLLAPAYVGVLGAVTDFLAPAVGTATATTPAWLVLPVAATMGGLTLLVRVPHERMLSLRDTLYVLALSAGHVARRRRAPGPAPRSAPAPRVLPAPLTAAWEGVAL
jgi:NADH:ubiquinone oxidoreductase subunit 5 (subunit L)/multisubunit Na+/H+ antiporter MnhA subunit